MPVEPVMSAADVTWSDSRDWEAGHATAREAIDASPHRGTFMATLAKFTAQANSHERIDVYWWSAPFIYIDVIDDRREYPASHRAMVSFDLTNGEFYSLNSSRRYGFARRGWVGFMARLVGPVRTYSDEPNRKTLADMAAGRVVVTGIPQSFIRFNRYRLSNGWFIDGATRKHGEHGGWKYSLFEPGGHPSGCAGLRGGAPTLALALAVANGEQPCGHALHGCRKLATGYRKITVRGREARVYHCEDHAPAPAVTSGTARKVAGTVTVAVAGRRHLELTDGAS